MRRWMMPRIAIEGDERQIGRCCLGGYECIDWRLGRAGRVLREKIALRP